MIAKYAINRGEDRCDAAKRQIKPYLPPRLLRCLRGSCKLVAHLGEHLWLCALKAVDRLLFVAHGK